MFFRESTESMLRSQINYKLQVARYLSCLEMLGLFGREFKYLPKPESTFELTSPISELNGNQASTICS